MNFDETIDRYNTNSLKFDFKRKYGKPDDIFPMWIADMDFRCAEGIIDKIQKRVEHGIFGYSETDNQYFDSVYNWYLKRHDVKLKQEWMFTTPGVVFALATCVRAYSKENDYVFVNNPVYGRFTDVILDNNRKVISSDLIYKDGYYELDFEDFEEKIKKYNIHLYLFCSPHNPVGRVWKKEELDKIVDICKKHDVLIVSDEIHSDFIWEGKHICMFKYQDFLDNIVLCTAPSKTFNLSGLQTANIFVPNENNRQKFKKEFDKTGYDCVNIMGITACEAAYTTGEEWFDELKKYLKQNIDYTEKFFKENIPSIKVVHPEALYLIWLDFNGLGLTDEEIDYKLSHEAKIWLKGGTEFSALGKGFQRLNTALPRRNLEYALKQLEKTFK